MAEHGKERLAAAVKAARFSYVLLQLPGYVLELRRDGADGSDSVAPAASPAESPPASRAAAPAADAVPVRAPAPGVLHLQVKHAEPVESGDQLGYVQMHGQQVPVLATTGGVVAEVWVDDGAFVAYGDRVMSLGGPDAQVDFRKADLETVPPEGGAE